MSELVNTKLRKKAQTTGTWVFFLNVACQCVSTTGTHMNSVLGEDIQILSVQCLSQGG